MKTKTNQLTIGTIVATGEVVTDVRKGINGKGLVTLKNSQGRERVAVWGWNSTIFVKTMGSQDDELDAEETRRDEKHGLYGGKIDISN